MASGSRPRLVILVPTKDEEDGVGPTLDGVPRKELEALGFQVELWVVDGNSTDATPQRARAHGAQVLSQSGRGKGQGLRQAFATLECDFLAMLDGDASYPAERLPQLVAPLLSGADVVLGRRLSSLEPGSMSTTHKLGNHLLSWLATFATGRRVRDLCTGMAAFRMDALRKLPLTSDGFEIEAEIYVRARRAKLNIVEVDIPYRVRAGASKLGGVRTGLRIGAAVLRFRFSRRPKAT